MYLTPQCYVSTKHYAHTCTLLQAALTTGSKNTLRDAEPGTVMEFMDMLVYSL